MPEGDTVHRTAATLRRVLEGQRIRTIELPRVRGLLPQVGSQVARVEARGKHLLVHTSDGLVLHTHLRMTGTWHVYRPGQRWQRPRRAVRAVIGIDGAVAVCFDAPIVEVLDDASLARHPALRQLGPDLCLEDPDLDDALARMTRRDPGDPVADVLLDQRVASGIGNVYKSEVCFVHHLDPATPLAAVDAATRRGLLTTAADLLRRNLDGMPRTTVPGAPPGTLYVYDRAGRPCRRCGELIVSAALGTPPRITYWCPGCQRTPG